MISGSKIEWLVPTTVVLSLAIGVLAALGHHVFYSSLDGSPAPNEDYHIWGSSLSRQQVNVAGGTAFAFLVKAALMTAISVTYVQLFWRAMLHTSRHTTLATLDTTFSVLSNAFALFKVWV